ncbi:glycosyltransferase involved in cell wall biosynthesis [Salinibacter ruber]|uniref:glycosyltransferase n=1 Tax=Salinibacter ruber TaxID=146919 RepID=UPI0021682B68|nr:glycosyltransferase [Salinibacter ruber]MCS3937065.1 glycosyltransferase involved in cell wall biosynthesis [Salinibacter ruber]
MPFSSTAAPDTTDSVLDVSFTAIVVTYNEDRRLRACLENLSFVDQLLVVDLGSEDRSVEIAEDCGASVLHYDRLPVVEQVRVRVVEKARRDWVFFVDPDEVFHPALAEHAITIIKNTEDVGRIFFPWKFYFRGRPLRGTRWGGKKHKGILIHKDRCKLSADVHRGIELKDEYRAAHISWEHPAHHIRHYWIDSYSKLFSKHLRYIRQEGESRFNSGRRFSWSSWVRETGRAFKRCLIDQQGWRDGATGVFLSLFNAWYESMSLLSLRRYQKSVSTPSEVSSP